MNKTCKTPKTRVLIRWSKDPKDTRSEVKLRHLLSFTSGYTEDSRPGRFCTSFSKCAQALYEASTSYVAPGTRFEYLSCHLQFAGAMAVAASGMACWEFCCTLTHSHNGHAS